MPLARRGQVHTFVINHTMPPPFEAPLPMAVVDLVDGSRVLLQGLPEDAADLAIGDPVDLELRRYATERGVPVYGYKARRVVPAAGPGTPPRRPGGHDGPGVGRRIEGRSQHGMESGGGGRCRAHQDG